MIKLCTDAYKNYSISSKAFTRSAYSFIKHLLLTTQEREQRKELGQVLRLRLRVMHSPHYATRIWVAINRE